MKRVLIIASVPSMIGQFNMGNIRILKELGYQADVACNFRDRSIWTEERTKKLENELNAMGIGLFQVDFTRSIRKVSCHIRAYRQLKRILMDTEYEFLHCHTPIAGALGRIAGHRRGLKVIYTAHGFHFYQGAPLKNWIFYYPVERLLSAWTEVLITINTEDYERAKKDFKAKKTKYVPGIGIDLERIQNVTINRKVKREELGIAEESVAILSVGELNRNKNHAAVIKAIAKLNDMRIHYFICGKGILNKYLEEECRRLSVESQVHLLGFRKDIYEIYKACDIYIHPSYREGLPVAVMEAMACGLPCMVSNIRGNRDLVKNGNNGICFSLKNQKDLKDSITYLIKNHETGKKFVKNSMITIKQNSQRLILEKMRQIYAEI